ncbi:MAG: hypothetical protein J2P15_21100, partial [Micromonosporaceae bacterium]|nr:hypothetical protein [Micromonosporaceae bacterium]
TRRRLGITAGLTGLAAGALLLTAACSTPVSTVSGAPATTPSSPAAASSPDSGPTKSSSKVTGHAASLTELSKLLAVAPGNCGYDSSINFLADASVTSNGWAIATVKAVDPKFQGDAAMVFRLHGSSWKYDTCGTELTDTVPADVMAALNKAALGLPKGRKATSSEVAQLTGLATGHCSFTTASYQLAGVTVTTDGWARAVMQSRGGSQAQTQQVAFRLKPNWTYVACGTDLAGSIPEQEPFG